MSEDNVFFYFSRQIETENFLSECSTHYFIQTLSRYHSAYATLSQALACPAASATWWWSLPTGGPSSWRPWRPRPASCATPASTPAPAQVTTQLHSLRTLHVRCIENSCRWWHRGHRHLLLLLQQLRQQAVAAAQGRRGAQPSHQGGPHVRAGEAGGGAAGADCACAGRAGNEPSRSLKFHNYGQGLLPSSGST